MRGSRISCNIPRVLLCAGSSNSGKTLLTCGILQALLDRGARPCAFKCGPDYIDPMFHQRAIGIPSRNLDTFFTEEEVLQYLLAENAKERDIAVIEGVMGYYDGLGGVSQKASTYAVGRATETPAILIVPCKGMSSSVAAYINGFKHFRPDSNIRGVILNRISGSLCETLRPYIAQECGVPVVGYVPEMADCQLKSRHLGLVMPDEIADLRRQLAVLSEVLMKTIDFDLLWQIAASAPPITAEPPREGWFAYRAARPVRVAIARDEAFCFLYEDNLRLLKEMGAVLLPFSPIHDAAVPPEADGMLLYGGYPELYADRLAANVSMRESVRACCRSGMPVLAECGGFMYLHDALEDMAGNVHAGVGCITGRAYKTDRLGRFGYISLQERAGAFFSMAEGQVTLPAHEFHYFDSTNCGEAMEAVKPVGKRCWRCMHSSPTMLAGFPHLYYYGAPQVPAVFLEKCLHFAQEHGQKG